MNALRRLIHRGLSDLVDARAPATRLAAFRIVLGVFVTGYLAIRLPVFLELRARATDRFDPVGGLRALDQPLPDVAVNGLLIVAFAGGLAFSAGWRFRIAGPVFALAVLALTTYRASWGQLLHFENLFVLLLFVVGCTRSADAWSIDARRRPPARPGATYGWPLQLCCLVVVTTYAIAGVAKLRLGGLEWVFGDTIRNHVAYASVRLELLGADGSPLAKPAVARRWLFTPMAIATLVIELGAPVALWWRRARMPWCVAAWLMHVGIFSLMLIGFPTPLFGVAFAPFFALERPVERLLARRRPDGSAGGEPREPMWSTEFQRTE